MTLGYVGFYVLPVLDPHNALGHVALTTGIFLLYVTGAYAARNIQHGKAFAVLVGFGLLYRLLLFPIEPSMSDDYHRYIWDGKVQAHGYNPYIYPPESDVLIHLKDPLYHNSINHPYLHSIYPPTSQWVFLLGYLSSSQSAMGLKAWLFLADLFTIFLLALFLKRRCRPPGYLLFYLWCPIPIIETMLDAHIDALAPPFLIAALLLAQRRRPYLTGAMMALAIMVKPLPIFLVPVLLWHFRWRRAFQCLLAMAIVGFLGYLPYLQAGPSMFVSIIRYSRHWHINGPFVKFFSQWYVSGDIRMVLGLVTIGVALIAPFLRLSLERRLLVPLAGYLMLTPTVYPWYFVWLAPFLAMTPTPWLFWFAGTISLVHTVHYFSSINGVWLLPGFLVCIEYIPIFLMIVVQAVPFFLRPWLRRWREQRWDRKAQPPPRIAPNETTF